MVRNNIPPTVWQIRWPNDIVQRYRQGIITNSDLEMAAISGQMLILEQLMPIKGPALPALLGQYPGRQLDYQPHRKGRVSSGSETAPGPSHAKLYHGSSPAAQHSLAGRPKPPRRHGLQVHFPLSFGATQG
jgi:hypothetical protein